MKMKSSKILFLILFLVFILAGSYLTLLSQGFVFDVEKFQILKTGAIFLSFEPRDAKIMINGKIQKASPSIFNNYVLIDRLLPNYYEITLSKENFRQWQKKVIVEPGLVKEFQKINLIPTEIKTTPINNLKNIDDFAISEKGIIYKKANKLFYNENILKGEKIITVDPRSSIIITSDKKDIYFLNQLNNLKSALNLNELFNSLKQSQLNLLGRVTIKKIWLHPFNPSKIILATDAALYELDTKKIKLQLLLFFENKITADFLNQNEIIFADTKGNLIFYNFLFRNRTIHPTELDANILKIEANNNSIGLLTEKGDFLIYNRSKNEIIETPFKKVKSFIFTPDGQYIIILDENEKVKIFSLTKNKFWKLSLPPSEIKKITPLPYLSNYMLTLIGNNLILSEIQSGYPTNWYLIVKSVKKYQIQNKNLYVLKENGELLTFPPLLSSSGFP